MGRERYLLPFFFGIGGYALGNSEEKRLMGGFLFQTEKEAKLAEVERKKIAYLESKVDYSKPEDILYIYDKTVKEMFSVHLWEWSI